MNLIYKIIPSLLLILSSGLKLIYTEAIVFSVVETGLFNWSIAPVAINSIIILEFFLGVSLLFKTIHIKLVSIAILLLSFLYLLNFFNQPTDGLHYNKFVFYLSNKWVFLAGITSLILFSIFYLIKSEERPYYNRKRNIILNILFITMISTPTFIINPIFIDDFQKNETSVQSPQLNWDIIFDKCKDSGIEINPETSTFFAFYSTSCYYCNLSSQMLGISSRISRPKTPIVFVFPGNKEDTEAFIKRNKCNFPYIRISKDEFRSLAGNEYPAFFKVENKKETHFYTGRTFNYRELDALFN